MEGTPTFSRFDIKGCLGSGGFGTVYAALDHAYSTHVALKVLHDAEPDALYRFKHEFRALRDITHPNLITLYELLLEAERYCLTMDWIRGPDLLSFVRGQSGPGARTVSLSDTIRASGQSQGAGDTYLEPMQRTADAERVRAGFGQLAEGVAALHAAGVIHRDLKPSNVLVTEAGRVVILDFGLAERLSAHSERKPARSRVVGTPRYMAPDAWLGAPESEATDWYSFGVMLYEALCGRSPHAGDAFGVLQAKATRGPRPPSAIDPDIPADLERLCLRLLEPDWRKRPDAREILNLFYPRGGEPGRGGSAHDADVIPLIGRDAESAALQRAADAAHAGQLSLVHVRGRSGLGKTALVRAFASSFGERARGWVLEGRCHERESLPYKAFDDVIDALHRVLTTLPVQERSEVLGVDANDLARLFPILRGVANEARAPAGAALAPESAKDLVRQRQEGFRAFRELLGRLCARRPLLIWIDDAQWGDADSAQLMNTLLAAPALAGLCVVLSYRDEQREDSPFLRETVPPETDHGDAVVADVPLRALCSQDTRALVLTRLLEASADEQVVEQLVQEAEGNPFFVEQLVRLVRSTPALLVNAEAGAISLRRALSEGLARLPPDARALLQLATVAGGSVAERVLLAAAEPYGSTLETLIRLRASNLLCVRRVGGASRAEVLHDRIRESMEDTLEPAQLSACHQRLAVTFAAEPEPDPEALAFHYHGAGTLEVAATWSVVAAERAASVLAFVRAAEHYENSVCWRQRAGAVSDAVLRPLLISRATALANAGRGAEAGPVFLDAAKRAPVQEAFDLRRLAAEQLLGAGSASAGTSLLRALLTEVGLSYPRATISAVARAMYEYARLKLRGSVLRERSVPHQRDRARLELCWSATRGVYLDPLRTSGLMFRYLRLAIDSQDPAHRTRAVCLLGALMMSNGTSVGFERGSALLEHGKAIVARHQEPLLEAQIGIYTGNRSLTIGEFTSAAEQVSSALNTLNRQCVGARYWQNVALGVLTITLEAQGRFGQLLELADSWRKDAKAHGDIYGELTALQCFCAPLRLVSGDVGGARSGMAEAAQGWGAAQGELQRLYELRFEVTADLYEHEPERACQRLRRAWLRLKLSQLLRVQSLRIQMQWLKARVSLAAAPRNPALLRPAARAAAILDREIRRDAPALAALVRAGIARQRGQEELTLCELDRAIQGFTAAASPLYAACARFRKGQILGGDEGATLRRTSVQFFERERVAEPERWLDLLSPGFAGESVTAHGRD